MICLKDQKNLYLAYCSNTLHWLIDLTLVAHQNLPESNPMRMEETRKRNALVMQVLKEAAETNDNIARGQGGPMK